MTSTTLTIDQIEVSRLNVRTYHPDIDDTAALEASILAEGRLLQPINVHPLAGSKKWGAIAGGRRTRAIKALVARGDLPKDWPVPVVQHVGLSEAELIELSITENLIRKDLRDHEICAAVARAAAKGHDADQIARGIAQPDVNQVRRWLRVGQLAPTVFAAYAAGRITFDLAKAYGATADQELQAATYARLAAGAAYAHTPQAVRLAMGVGDVEQRKLLLFVGADAYRAAGGRFELDLFAEAADERGRVVDRELLQRLADKRVTAIRDDVRMAVDRPALRFVPKPPQTSFDTPDWRLRIETGGDLASARLPAGDIVAHVAIDREGAHEVSFWWASTKAKHGADRPAAPLAAAPPTPVAGHAIANALHDGASPGLQRQADRAIAEEDGVGAEAIQVLRAQRRAILRAILVRDADAHGTVARDYLVWAQLRMLAGEDHSMWTGLGRLHTETIGRADIADKARAQIDASGVAGPVSNALRELTAQTFSTGTDLAAAFLDFLTSADRLKNLAAAVVAGLALERSLRAPAYDLPVHDAVAQATDFAADRTVRETWHPTVELLGLTRKQHRVDLALDLVDEPTRTKWQTLRNDEITDRVLATVTAAEDWVHPMLSFAPRPPADPAPDDVTYASAELEEAEA